MIEINEENYAQKFSNREIVTDLYIVLSSASLMTIRDKESIRNEKKKEKDKKEIIKKTQEDRKSFLCYNLMSINANCKYVIWCKGQVQEQGNRETEFHDSKSTLHERANH